MSFILPDALLFQLNSYSNRKWRVWLEEIAINSIAKPEQYILLHVQQRFFGNQHRSIIKCNICKSVTTTITNPLLVWNFIHISRHNINQNRLFKVAIFNSKTDRISFK